MAILNIGIGIEIGTDIINVNISTFIRPMAPKLSRMVTQDEGTTPTKSPETSIPWSRDKRKML